MVVIAVPPRTLEYHAEGVGLRFRSLRKQSPTHLRSVIAVFRGMVGPVSALPLERVSGPLIRPLDVLNNKKIKKLP